MITPFIQANLFIQRAEFAIDARPDESILGQLCQLFLEFTFTAANDGRQDHDALAFGQREYTLQNLIDTLPRDRRAAAIAMRLANR